MTALQSPQYRLVDGLRVRYATGGSATGRPVLLTSPLPESLIAFGALSECLADAAPLLAVDLPGFGQSDVRADLMHPRAMGDFIVKLVREFSLDAPHAVCPDIGTSAILYAAADHDRMFTSATVGGGAVDERALTGPLKDLVAAPDMTTYENVDGGDVVVALVGQMRETPPSDDELRDYHESYAGDRFVKAAAYVRTYPRSLPPLRALLPTISTPVQVIYGLRDPLVPPENGELLGRALPHVRVIALDTGHFAWDDAASAYAEALRTWIAGGYRTVM